MYEAITKKFEIVNQRKLAKIVGLTPSTMCRIVNAKQPTRKTTAYCIVKAIHPEAEINDYFIKKGE